MKVIFSLLVMLAICGYSNASTITVCQSSRSIDKGCIPIQDLQLYINNQSNKAGNEDIVITLPSGVFELKSPITISKLNKFHSIKIVGKGPLETIIKGTKSIDLPSLDTTKDFQLLSVNLSDYDVTPNNQGNVKFGARLVPNIELFIDGKRQERASTETKIKSYDEKKNLIELSNFQTNEKDKQLRDLFISGFFFNDWAFESFNVVSSELGSNLFSLLDKPSYGAKLGKSVTVYNAPGFIVKNGNWAWRSLDNLIFIGLDKSFATEKHLYEVSNLKTAFNFSENKNVTLENFSIDGFLEYGVYAANFHNLKLNNLHIRNVGATAIKYDGTNAIFQALDISDIGGVGVVLKGGSKSTLESSNNSLVGSKIFNTGVIQRSYAPAIIMDGVGNIAESNVISNGPHAAVIFHGNNNLISKNKISKFAQSTDDVGAIYTGQNFLEQGNRIEDNLISDIGNPQLNVYGANAIYMDDLASGNIIKGNTILNSYRGLLLGGGSSNSVIGNTFIGCTEPIKIDARGLDMKEETKSRFLKKLNDRSVNRQIYSTYYPHLNFSDSSDNFSPKNNIIQNNIFDRANYLVKARSVIGGFQFIQNNIDSSLHRTDVK